MNGLYTYDRKEKVSTDKLKAIMDAAKNHYHQHLTAHQSTGLKKLWGQYKYMVDRGLPF